MPGMRTTTIFLFSAPILPHPLYNSEKKQGKGRRASELEAQATCVDSPLHAGVQPYGAVFRETGRGDTLALSAPPLQPKATAQPPLGPPHLCVSLACKRA